jgi:integrase/recombinase XerD
MTSPTLVGPLLQFFFTDYLIAQRRVSPQTIASYRDTFRLLLQFVDHEIGVGPTALPVASLDAGIILRFLDGLEKNRGNSVISRNLRLTAIAPSTAWWRSAIQPAPASPRTYSPYRSNAPTPRCDRT